MRDHDEMSAPSPLLDHGLLSAAGRFEVFNPLQEHRLYKTNCLLSSVRNTQELWTASGGDAAAAFLLTVIESTQRAMVAFTTLHT